MGGQSLVSLFSQGVRGGIGVVDDNKQHRGDVSAGGVVHRYAAAWESGDVGGILGCYAETVITHYGGQSPFAGTHVGRDRLVEVLLLPRRWVNASL